MRYSNEVAKQIGDQAKGKVIASLERVNDGEVEYWVMTFTDGEEMSFRFMAELI